MMQKASFSLDGTKNVCYCYRSYHIWNVNVTGEASVGNIINYGNIWIIKRGTHMVFYIQWYYRYITSIKVIIIYMM